ncbi:carbonic anhydrase [Desulfitobacterium sp. Sab5]|uniref:carbonic anhydrase n=1 Tax=Desulfitobacterium nosdiversum TaxID=3375356 RepID=UPI003CEA5490
MKKFMSLLGLLLIGTLLLSGCSSKDVYSRPEIISSPDQAKELLIAGNQRFMSGNILAKDLSSNRRSELSKGQHPFAVIVSCSDSRVPPEEIFDQALGDLFVVRVAGNVITPVELGSVEYAVEHLKVPLVLVLGHEKCGAITAAVEGGKALGSISAITEKIMPALKEIKNTEGDKETVIEKTAELNVLNSLQSISQSPVIKHALGESHKLYGGKYRLETGEIQWPDTSKIF